MHRFLTTTDLKLETLSETRYLGGPKIEKTCLLRTAAVVSALVFLTGSIRQNLEKESTTVKIYLFLLRESGRGPIWSMKIFSHG